LLGVHIVGDGAVELVHIDQAELSMKGSIDYFVNTVFNYPTLAEYYKNDGINRLGARLELPSNSKSRRCSKLSLEQRRQDARFRRSRFGEGAGSIATRRSGGALG
jgi:hypothetical protein